MKRPAWFWVTIEAVGQDERRRTYCGPVLAFSPGSATVRAGNRVRRRHPGVWIVGTETLRGGHWAD